MTIKLLTGDCLHWLVHVSAKYMDRYLKEFTFRSNHRGMQNAMFDLLIGAV